MRNQNIIDLYTIIKKSRTICAKISNQIKIDSSKLLEILTIKFTKKFGFNSYTFPTLIIPNTYEVYANITEFNFDLVRRQYKKFNSSRTRKQKIGLTQSEVIILVNCSNGATTKI